VEIIKVSNSEDEWEVVDKVCKALALGEEKEVRQLRYQKYHYLDFSNLKELEVQKSCLA
jgi:hypothetical protein